MDDVMAKDLLDALQQVVFSQGIQRVLDSEVLANALDVIAKAKSINGVNNE